MREKSVRHFADDVLAACVVVKYRRHLLAAAPDKTVGHLLRRCQGKCACGVVVGKRAQKFVLAHRAVQRVEQQTTLYVGHHHVFAVVFVGVYRAEGGVGVVVVAVEHVNVRYVIFGGGFYAVFKGRKPCLVHVQTGQKFAQTLVHPRICNLVVAHNAVKPLVRRFVDDGGFVGLLSACHHGKARVFHAAVAEVRFADGILLVGVLTDVLVHVLEHALLHGKRCFGFGVGKVVVMQLFVADLRGEFLVFVGHDYCEVAPRVARVMPRVETVRACYGSQLRACRHHKFTRGAHRHVEVCAVGNKRIADSVVGRFTEVVVVDVAHNREKVAAINGI